VQVAPFCRSGHSHWQVVVFKVWPVGKLVETQLPLHSTCPDGQAAHLPPEQLPLQHCLFFLHFFTASLHSSSAAATPPSDPSAPSTRAAPISLSALPREMLPLASPLASSSKERSLASGEIGRLLERTGPVGPAESINAFSVKG